MTNQQTTNEAHKPASKDPCRSTWTDSTDTRHTCTRILCHEKFDLGHCICECGDVLNPTPTEVQKITLRI